MNILSFDIEDWFHILDHQEVSDKSSWAKFPSRIENNLDRILNILKIKNVKATFFCLGWVGAEFPHLVKRIVNEGHDIGTHSNFHTLVYTQTPSDFESDLKKSIDILSEITGQNITKYRAPGFSIGKSESWTFEILAKNGITIDCSIFPALRAHGGFNKFPVSSPSILELNSKQIKIFPMNIKSIFNFNYIFSGGGYFRLLPYPLIKKLMKNSNYVMTYFHPRDFDPHQPVMPNLSYFRKFKSYYGLKNAEKKLCKLLDDYKFISIESANQKIDWKTVSRVSLNDIKN